MKKFLRAAGAAVLAASLVGCSVYAESDSSADNNKDSEKTEEKSSDTTKALSYSSDQTGKEETVYVFTDANGQQNKVIVSDKLHTAGQSGSIKDYSNLKDIINVSGDEEFTQDADGNITWQSDGKDISYQGTSDKEIPVDVKVTYYLNDQEVSADQISGASGHIKIRYDYTNNATEQVAINGQTETVKVPFAMVTGLILNNSFSNVSVTNGKMIQYENNDIVYGIAFPGLKDSLKLDSYDDIDLDNYDIPEYVEIEGDTTNFGIDMSMTYASSNLLNDLAGSEDIDLSDLTNSVNDLDNAATQLVDGTKTLKDGTSQLKDGANQLDSGAQNLVDGTTKLSAGASTLYDGANTLANGASSLASGASKLAAGASSAYSGASTLSNVLGQLSANSETLNKGADEIAQGILDTANQQLKANNLTKDLPPLKLTNYATVLGDALGVDTLRAAALQQVEAAVKSTGTDVDENTVKALIYMASIHSTNDFQKDLTTQGARAAQAQAIAQATAIYTDKTSALKSQKVQAVLSAYKQQLLNNITVPSATDDQMNQVYAQIASTLASDPTVKGLMAQMQLTPNQINNIANNLTAQAVTGLAQAKQNITTASIKAALKQQLGANAAQVPAMLDALKDSQDYKNANKYPAYAAFVKDQYEAAYKQQYTATVNAMNNAALYDQIANTIKQNGSYDDASIAKLIGYTCDNYDQSKSLEDQLIANGTALQDAAQVAVEMQNAKTDAGQEKINGALDVQVNGNAQVSEGKKQIQSLESSLDRLSQFVEGLKTYTAGVDSVYAGSKKLVSGLNDLNNGAAALSNGTAQLNTGAASLASGAATLNNGAASLLAGTKTLKSGTESLSNGIVQLDDGADTLMNGMQQFYDEGIKKISDVFGDELTSVVDRVKSVLDSGTNYTTYGGALEDKNNTVRFIFKTDTINADDSDK